MPEDGITLRGTTFKVSATEKRSTGEYENYQPHASIEGELPAPESELDPETRSRLRAELLSLHHDLQKVVVAAADNRVKELEEQEEWDIDPAEAEV